MISILTTVYNGSEFLEDCAKSIILQQCQHGAVEFTWEWWIGINGHGETGGDALQVALRVAGGSPNIHVVNLPEVKGRVAALNALRQRAAGEWLAVLDCDDIWEENKLLTQMIAIQMASRPIDIIGTFCTYFGDILSAGPTLPSGWIGLEQVMAANPIINSSVLFRADLPAWEERFGLEDYDLWIRAAKAGRTLFNVPHPLVRHRIHGGSSFNGKGVQDVEGLRMYHMATPTVVSAYYPIRSKYDVKEYIQWILQFWPRIPCRLVFYTDPSLVDTFERVFAGRLGTKIVGLAFSELSAFQKLSPLVWVETHKLDIEKGHTPELYALWYEKKEFVLRTIQSNPFSSSQFVWCDAGIGRYPEWFPFMQRFPAAELIPRGQMLALEIEPLKEVDCTVDAHGIPGRFDSVSTLGGGILASDIEGWYRWSKAYDAMLMRYYLAGRFIGKDQNIMASMILKDPSLVQIVKRHSSLGTVKGWFYLLFFLSRVSVS